jgi:ABC-type lipoprotein export system ATPase subunit/GNAT superfamily N-acetyltransferase
MVRRCEHFRINRWARRYDRESGKFVVNISYETAAPKPSKRVVAVAESFGLGLDKWERFVVYENVELKIGPRDIVLITGDSGSGKSVLLKALEKDVKEGMNAESINIGDVQLDPCKPLIETVGKTLEEGLELLSKVGLNDAFLFLRTFEQLSDGQKYRYRIAKMMESEAQFWIMDEFAATLDRDTAKIVAFNVQKLARQEGKAVLAATTHTDLLEDLKPSVHVHKRFGKEIQVKYYPNEINKECSLVKEMHVAEGSRQDYYQLAGFHYRSHKVAGVRKIFSLKRGEELCGVVVYSYPPAACFGRRMVLPRMSMRELNEKLSIISRVVVHPKYRTIGLGHKLIRETLEHAGTPYVETVAVMAKYNPFFEKAGIRKIAESQPVKEALKVADLLKAFGFNITFLRSQKYVLNRLSELNSHELSMLKTVFSENRHPRFMKEFSFHDPYGMSRLYVGAVESADSRKLSKLIGICSLLLQTKFYLFWRKEEDR